MTRLTLSPLTDLDRTERVFDRLFSDLTGSAAEANEGTDSLRWLPPTDVWETDDAFVFSVDLPGLKKENLEIVYDEGVLRISGERHAEHEYGDVHRSERRQGRFYRAFRLDEVQSDKIEASLDNGVLIVHVPKARKRRSVSVKVK